MALHTDTARPHVHVTIEAQGIDGKRFDPRREDLFRFREVFAEALRRRGVEAEATPRYTRGQGRAGTSLALAQMRARIRNGIALHPTEADIRQAREAVSIVLGKAKQPAFVINARERWSKIRQSFENAARVLDRTGTVADRNLSIDIGLFLSARQTLDTASDQALKEAAESIRAARKERSELIVPVQSPPARAR